jgi:hypothetical protein
LNGSELYLINGLSMDSAFTSPTNVPDGFVDTSLSFPRPAANAATISFFVRLRDDPNTSHAVTLPLEIDLAPPLVAAPPPPAALTPPPV